MSEIKKEVAEKSILITGAVGVGKTTVANKLGELTNMPVVPLDLLRHCPMTIAEIERNRKNKVFDDKTCDEHIRLRKMFPNVPNYETMLINDGAAHFDGMVSTFLDGKFGKVAWHFYQKQFENMLLAAVMEQATEPCIFDLGGGMAVSLDYEYSKYAKEFKRLDAELFKKHFDLSKIGVSHIKRILGQFSHVICLDPPSDYMYRRTRASQDELNPAFIKSGQYHERATDARHIINVENLILHGNAINRDKLDEIANQIVALTAAPKLRK